MIVILDIVPSLYYKSDRNVIKSHCGSVRRMAKVIWGSRDVKSRDSRDIMCLETARRRFRPFFSMLKERVRCDLRCLKNRGLAVPGHKVAPSRDVKFRDGRDANRFSDRPESFGLLNWAFFYNSAPSDSADYSIPVL